MEGGEYHPPFLRLKELAYAVDQKIGRHHCNTNKVFVISSGGKTHDLKLVAHNKSQILVASPFWTEFLFVEVHSDTSNPFNEPTSPTITYEGEAGSVDLTMTDTGLIQVHWCANQPKVAPLRRGGIIEVGNWLI